MKKTCMFVLAVCICTSVCYGAARWDVILEDTDFDSGKVVVARYPEAVNKSMFEFAGIKPGDRITDIDGIKIDSPRTFFSVMERIPPAKSVSIGVERKGKKLVYEVTPAPIDFRFMYYLGKEVSLGHPVDLAIAVTSTTNDPDNPVLSVDAGGLRSMSRLWREILTRAIDETKKNRVFGSYTDDLNVLNNDMVVSAVRESGIDKGTAVTGEQMGKLKALTGATHFLSADYSIAALEDGKTEEKIGISLFDLKNERLEGMVEIVHIYGVNGKMEKNVVDGYETEF